MKNIDEITRLTADDLERISLDESIPVPEELSGKVQQAVRGRTLRWAVPTGVAAAIAVLLAVGLTWNPEPKDTFDDPYLAYAEVEKVFSKISGTVAYGADKISESEATLDKYSYWK
jgi:hypothetical protein